MCMHYAYRIALIFHGSKFSRFAVFDNFVEKNSRIRCRSIQWCKVSKFSLKYLHEVLYSISAIQYEIFEVGVL